MPSRRRSGPPLPVRPPAWHLTEVSRLPGRKGLASETPPPVGEPVPESEVGYHLREGGHSIEMFDWLRFLDFAAFHLKR